MQTVGLGMTRGLEPTADELARKTKQYWELSSSWNGRTGKRLSCGSALDVTRKLVTNINPSRPLYKVTIQTEDEIIRNQKRKPNETPQQNLLQFRKA